MNKKDYKGYELAEAVDNGILNLKQKVKTANNMEYYNCTIDFILKDIAKNIMFKEFVILEDNTEEIEELYIEKIYNTAVPVFIKESFELCQNKINELVKVINEIRKDKNND